MLQSDFDYVIKSFIIYYKILDLNHTSIIYYKSILIKKEALILEVFSYVCCVFIRSGVLHCQIWFGDLSAKSLDWATSGPIQVRSRPQTARPVPKTSQAGTSTA